MRQYAKPYLFTVIVVSGLVFLEVMATLRLPDLMSRIVDEGIARGNLGLIWRVGALMLAVALGGVVCSIAGNYLASRASGKFGRDVRLAVFRRVGEFSPASSISSAQHRLSLGLQMTYSRFSTCFA